MALNYFCFDIGGVCCTHESTSRAVALGKQYWGDLFSEEKLKQMQFANLENGRDYWREFQNGLLAKEDYLEKSLTAGDFPVSEENISRFEKCLQVWCGDPYQPVLDVISQLKQRGHHTGVLTNNNEIMYATPSGRVQYLVDVATSSHEIHVSKPEEEAYVRHLDRIGAKAEEVFFIDDKLVNVRAFEKLGGCGFNFRSKEMGMDAAFEKMMEFLQKRKIL